MVQNVVRASLVKIWFCVPEHNLKSQDVSVFVFHLLAWSRKLYAKSHSHYFPVFLLSLCKAVKNPAKTKCEMVPNIKKQKTQTGRRGEQEECQNDSSLKFKSLPGCQQCPTPVLEHRLPPPLLRATLQKGFSILNPLIKTTILPPGFTASASPKTRLWEI